jgi:hypothetical protein
MDSLKRLALGISLTVILASTAIAGETSAPPCVNPGETSAPPCPMYQPIVDDANEASSSVSSEVETIVVEAATYAVESLLTLF